MAALASLNERAVSHEIFRRENGPLFLSTVCKLGALGSSDHLKYRGGLPLRFESAAVSQKSCSCSAVACDFPEKRALLLLRSDLTLQERILKIEDFLLTL